MNTILVREAETEIDDETVWIDLVIWQRKLKRETN